MDFFAIGGKPLLSRFPPHLPGLFAPHAFRLPDPAHVAATSSTSVATPDEENRERVLASGLQGTPDVDAAMQQQLVTLGQLHQYAQIQHIQQLQHLHTLQNVQLLQQLQMQQIQIQQLMQECDTAADADGKLSDAKSPDGSPPEDSPEAAPENAYQASAQTNRSTCPLVLHRGFNPEEVQDWEPGRFEHIRKLQDASRNRGQVHLMRDTKHDRLVAVKQMPTRWVRKSHAEFVVEHPSETELPWQDVGCVRYLNSVGYPFGCDLLGVYRDEEFTFVVTSLATEGDLFAWCESGFPPGPDRERAILPIVRQIFEGIRALHDLGISHRDLSLENCLLTKDGPDGELRLRIIDFSMASTSRMFQYCVRGKASYQAPELHLEEKYDGFLSDAFSVGVTIYAMILKDYPWLSTRPGGCKCFEYVRKNGLRTYCQKRKLRNSSAKVADFLSEPLQSLLEGLLCLDPEKRLTLGEAAFGNSRRSVWDEPWTHTGPDS